MENLKDILDGLAKESGWGKKWDRAKIWNRWAEILPPEIAKITKPLNILKKDVLLVGVENNYIMQELNFQKPIIIERINSILQPENRIKDVKFVLNYSIDSDKGQECQENAGDDVELNSRVLERLKGIEDPDLRETLLSLYKTSKRRRKIKPES